MEEATARYIESPPPAEVAADEEMTVAFLRAQGYAEYDTVLLESPEYAANDTLEQRVTGGPGVNYRHILSLKVGELNHKEAARRRQKVAKLAAELADTRAVLGERPPCASVWLREIGELEAAIAKWRVECALALVKPRAK